ncbi:MAG: hypothetical protein MRZ93_09305 [Lachnospiraceae bacterium]|nr:hypothetical protein [Lachnospiraceae bacterium]
MEKLLEKLDDAAKLVAPMLEEKISEEIYINALRELILALNETTAEEIEKLEINFAVKNSLGADKSLIKKSFPKEADQVSLISTLVTYEACRREGMPDHSRIYMDRVTALRHHIDHYYGERSQQFCGS